MKKVICFILALLSTPFFMLGFAMQFAFQGLQDGAEMGWRLYRWVRR